jgi:Uma2 family endonuclease
MCSFVPEPPERLLTVDAYVALGEDDRYRSELQEGHCPDLIVAHQSAVGRVRRNGGILRACDVLVVVGIVSPGSHRTDHVIKHGEYAEAGIPHYWIVDLDDPVTLIDCHLAGEFGYQDASPVTDRFVTTELFPVGLRLDGLLPD